MAKKPAPKKPAPKKPTPAPKSPAPQPVTTQNNPAPKKPAPKKPAPKKPAPKKPKAPTPPATPREYATTDEAFIASLESLRKTDPQLYRTVVGGMGFGRKVEEEMLSTRLSEDLPRKLQDLEDEATREFERSGTVDPMTQRAIDEVARQMETAGQMSPEQREALARMKAGLGGYTAPELQAMREQTLRSVGEESDVKTQQLLGKLGARNIQGGLAGKLSSNIALQAVLARGNLESKLLAENAAVQDARMKQYSGTLGDYEDMAGRQRMSALDIFARTNLEAGQNLADRRQNAFNTMANMRRGNVGFTTGIQQENRAIQREGMAQRYSMPLSMGQLFVGNQQLKENMDLARENLALTRRGQDKMVEAARAGAGGGGGWSIPPPEPGFEEPTAAPAGGAAPAAQGTPPAQGTWSVETTDSRNRRGMMTESGFRAMTKDEYQRWLNKQPKPEFGSFIANSGRARIPNYDDYLNRFNDQGGGGLV